MPDDARRTRIFKRLKGFGQPVQKSVFECDLDEDQIAKMEEKLRALVAEEDLVRIYRVRATCAATISWLGSCAKIRAEVVTTGRAPLRPRADLRSKGV